VLKHISESFPALVDIRFSRLNNVTLRGLSAFLKKYPALQVFEIYSMGVVRPLDSSEHSMMFYNLFHVLASCNPHLRSLVMRSAHVNYASLPKIPTILPQLETLDLRDYLTSFGYWYPGVEKLVSFVKSLPKLRLLHIGPNWAPAFVDVRPGIVILLDEGTIQQLRPRLRDRERRHFEKAVKKGLFREQVGGQEDVDLRFPWQEVIGSDGKDVVRDCKKFRWHHDW